MGCACKQVRQINNKFDRVRQSKMTKRGKLVDIIKNDIISILMKIVTLLIVLILIPILFLILMFNIIVYNKFRIGLPKRIYEIAKNSYNTEFDEKHEIDLKDIYNG